MKAGHSANALHVQLVNEGEEDRGRSGSPRPPRPPGGAPGRTSAASAGLAGEEAPCVGADPTTLDAMRVDGKIDYVELPGVDLPKVKAFYGDAFGWKFTDYGPGYTAFEEGIDGGFHGGEAVDAKPLIILYAHDLEAMEAKVRAAGGKITKSIFAFPGGRRFHFTDPAGNELAVWSST